MEKAWIKAFLQKNAQCVMGNWQWSMVNRIYEIRSADLSASSVLLVSLGWVGAASGSERTY
jgi:hypothetical protein